MVIPDTTDGCLTYLAILRYREPVMRYSSNCLSVLEGKWIDHWYGEGAERQYVLLG
jgi:hypothetical protein